MTDHFGARLHAAMARFPGAETIRALASERDLTLRTAAYVHALHRIGERQRNRGEAVARIGADRGGKGGAAARLDPRPAPRRQVRLA